MTAGASPRRKATIAGLFYLLTIVTGFFAEGFASGRLVTSDAATTASNILANESLFRLAFAVYLIEMACTIVTTGLFYDLLRPVNRGVSLLAAFFSLAGATIKIMGRLFFFAPLLLLGGAPYLNAFSAEELRALALFLLKLNSQAAAIALVFLGFGTLLKGYLILKSTFLPRFLGVLGIVGGVGWATFVWPPFAYSVFPVLLAIGLIGSAASIFWLLVFGVNEERWKEQARAAGQMD